MKKYKSIAAIFLCVIITLSGYTQVYAGGMNTDVTNQSQSLSVNDKEEIEPYSTELPTSIWNISQKGRYNFGGQADKSTLYSNYLFTGVSKVRIRVNNNSGKTLTVELKKDKSGLNTVTSYKRIKANSYAVWTVDIDSSAKYYLRFAAESNFSGYIEKA